MGQKAGEKWTAAVDLQPMAPKSDRLLQAPCYMVAAPFCGKPTVTTTDHHTCYFCSQRRLLLQSAALSLVLPGAGLGTAHAEGVEVGRNSVLTNLVPAETVERSAAQQYAQMLQQAAAQKALAGNDNRQLRSASFHKHSAGIHVHVTGTGKST